MEIKEKMQLEGNPVENRSIAWLAWGMALSDTASPRCVSHPSHV